MNFHASAVGFHEVFNDKPNIILSSYPMASDLEFHFFYLFSSSI